MKAYKYLASLICEDCAKHVIDEQYRQWRIAKKFSNGDIEEMRQFAANNTTIQRMSAYRKRCKLPPRPKWRLVDVAQLELYESYLWRDDEILSGPFPDGGGPSDTPQHCSMMQHCCHRIHVRKPWGYIGCWLGNPLTKAGIDYVQIEIEHDAAKVERKRSPVIALWKEWYAPVLKLKEKISAG